MTEAPPPDQRLPCGRDPLDVVDRARAGHSDDHELGCPYCQAEIDAAGRSLSLASDLAALDSDVVVPPTLLPAVMRGVWSELRRSTDISLPAVDGGITVSDRAIVSVLNSVLDGLDLMHVHTCRVLISEPDSDTARTAPQLAVEVRAAAAYNTDVPVIAEQARSLVAETLHRQFALAAVAIDIDIIDVFVPGEPVD